MHSGNLPNTKNNNSNVSRVAVTDLRVLEQNEQILTELKIMNTYNALGHDEVLTEQDIEEKQ